jgi:hypothetical protein
MNNVEVKFEGMHTYAFLDGYWFYLDNFPNLGWGYTTSDINLAEKYGFKKELFDFEYFLPIKDIGHTRGFESNVFCKYKGYGCVVYSYNACDNNLFCLAIPSGLALKLGYNWSQISHEILVVNVPLSEIDEIYRRRKKLGDFIFDVDPIKPIYKDGKWLIEPDENGVYVI